MEELLITCDQCGGSIKPAAPSLPPKVQRTVDFSECLKCQGHGRVLTEAGRAIAVVVAHLKAGGAIVVA